MGMLHFLGLVWKPYMVTSMNTHGLVLRVINLERETRQYEMKRKWREGKN